MKKARQDIKIESFTVSKNFHEAVKNSRRAEITNILGTSSKSGERFRVAMIQDEGTDG